MLRRKLQEARKANESNAFFKRYYSATNQSPMEVPSWMKPRPQPDTSMNHVPITPEEVARKLKALVPSSPSPLDQVFYYLLK